MVPLLGFFFFQGASATTAVRLTQGPLLEIPYREPPPENAIRLTEGPLLEIPYREPLVARPMRLTEGPILEIPYHEDPPDPSARLTAITLETLYLLPPPPEGCFGTNGGPVGTRINEVSSDDMLALMLRVHRQAKTQQNYGEMYFCREDQWNLFPIQPDFSKDRPVTVSKTYRQPSTCSFTIPDTKGLLRRTNRNSFYNYRSDTTTFDPVLDAKRKIMLRCGTLCWQNLTTGVLATSSLAPSFGELAELTDDVLADITVSEGGYVEFSPSDDTPVDIDLDLGSVKRLEHYAIRLATKNGAVTFPAFVSWGWSTDGSTWHYTASPRPVGGAAGDWDDDHGIGAQTIESFKTDLEVYARYIRFRVVPTGAQTFAVDELAVFGGQTIGFYGGNYWVGFLGGSTKPDWQGNIAITATDVLKKCLDNSTKRLTSQYGGIIGPIDAADIVHDLLTDTSIWKQTGSQYFAPFTAAQIGWNLGDNAAKFKFPVWQGQSNSIYGYLAEIMHTIGFDVPVDHEGVIQLFEPPYRQVLPDRVFIADEDGNNDCWQLEPLDDDTNLRNHIVVRSGDPKAGATSTVKTQPSSIASYGDLLTEIDDPVAFDQGMREKIAGYFLRDYAFNLCTITGVIKPDFSTHIKQVIGFRASRFGSMYANDLVATEDVRAQQLWIIDQYDEHIWVGDWTANFKASQYVGLGPNPPFNLTATPRVGDDTIIDLHWEEPSDADIGSYRVYYSIVSDSAGFIWLSSSYISVGSTDEPFGVTVAVSVGTQYWFYMTSLGQNGIESEPSSVVTAIAGTESGDVTKWTITDLRADFIQEVPPSGSGGLWGYQFNLAWTSPPVGASAFDQATYGFKQGEFGFAFDAIPDNPLDKESWIRPQDWHGDRIPSLLTWGRLSVGDLTWPLVFNTNASLSGRTLYFRIFTWYDTHGQHGPSFASNIVSVTVP